MRLRRTLLATAAALLALGATRTARGAAVIHLPFPQGVSVSILQGYNGGTHQGVERYSLDLTRDDGKTSNTPALAPAAGTVVWSYPPGTGNGCVGIQIDGGDGLHEMLCHLLLSHDYQNGEHVTAGQVLGLIAPPGAVGNNGVAHIHLQLYRVVGGARTPEPFAAPDGAPLEGVSLAAGSSYNQWACNGSGPGCHIVSQNGPGGAAPAPSSPSRTITSASSGGSAAASVSTPRQNIPLAIGVPVMVSGTGDCLNIHDQPATSAKVVYCLPDGTQAVLTDGPQTAGGYTWFKLDGLGWGVADYLVATGPGSTAPAPTATAAPTTAPAAAPPLPPAPTPAPTPQPAPAQPTATPTNTERPIGVGFSIGDSVTVAGTGDCLRVHSQPGLGDDVLDCLPDGTTATIGDGPNQADGYVWWYLTDHGWVDGEFLTAH